jgi:hypothetical protein
MRLENSFGVGLVWYDCCAVMEALISANGAHWVSAQEIPRRETRSVEGIGERVRDVERRIIELRMWEAVHARGSVSHGNTRRDSDPEIRGGLGSSSG